MEICPVCETPHDARALECANCGHVFQPAAVDASVVPLADLEPTRTAELEVGVELTPGLEPTRFEAGPAAEGVPVEGLEPTLSPPAEVEVEATPDLQPTVLAEPDLPSAIPAEPTCASCGQVAGEDESFCARCGMRLPRFNLRVAEGSSEMGPVCSSCGSQSFAGGVCSRCGARQPSTG